jgi:hypothetical protein
MVYSIKGTTQTIGVRGWRMVREVATQASASNYWQYSSPVDTQEISITHRGLLHSREGPSHYHRGRTNRGVKRVVRADQAISVEPRVTDYSWASNGIEDAAGHRHGGPAERCEYFKQYIGCDLKYATKGYTHRIRAPAVIEHVSEWVDKHYIYGIHK